MSEHSWKLVLDKISNQLVPSLKEISLISLMKSHGWTSLHSLNILSENHRFLISKNCLIWSRRINLDGSNISKRTIPKIIPSLIWLKEWVNKKKKWELSWKWLLLDALDRIELWLPVINLLVPFSVTNISILFHILCKISGQSLRYKYPFFSCCLQELIQPVLLMTSLERKRRLLRRFLWVRVKNNLLERLLSQPSRQEDGLFCKIVSSVSSSWRKHNRWSLASVIQIQSSLMKTSDYGLPASHILNSLLVFSRKSWKSQTSLLRVSRQVSTKHSQLWSIRNSSKKLTIPTGRTSSSQSAISTQSSWKEENSVL